MGERPALRRAWGRERRAARPVPGDVVELSWDVAGPVRLRIGKVGDQGAHAFVSAVFFDEIPEPR